MIPLRNPDGSLAPERDARWVTISVMAEYVGVSRWSLHQWHLKGLVPPGCTKRFGTKTRWSPALYFSDVRRMAGVQ